MENYPERKKLLDDYHKNYEKEIATSVEYKNLLLGVRSLDPEKAAISREKLRKMWRAYRAQVVPLEDVKQILNIASPIAKLACICRRMYRASFDEKLCIGLGVYLDYVKEWPDFHRGFITWSPYLNRPVIDVTRCFGCGVCRVVCETEAIELIDRETIPIVRELW